MRRTPQNQATHRPRSRYCSSSTPTRWSAPTITSSSRRVRLTKVDWEAELAVVIGKRASYLASPEEALDYVAGYTVSNDVSERSYQVDHSGGQWFKGKCCATFNPLGPALVPNTGTPQGVALSGKFPYLREGDSMEISIEQLGRQEQKLVAFRR